MAQTLTDILAGLQLSADEKKLFDSTLTKNPALKEGWLRQDDYSRKMDELRTQESAVKAKETEVLAQREQQEAWADKTVPVWERLVEQGIVNDDGEELWSSKQADYERQLTEARAAAVAGGDMKQEDVEKIVADIVKNAGGATKDEVDALVKQHMKKAADDSFQEGWRQKETEFNEKTIPFVAGFSAASGVVAMRYEKETGEKWTAEKQQEMFALMGSKKNFDPFAVEEELLKPHRDKKATEAEIEKRVKERTTQMRAEQGGDGDYIPQDKQKGALQRMMEQSGAEKTGDKDADFMSLIDQKAREAGSALRQEGKVGA